MARTAAEINADIERIRCALKEMESTKEGSVGLRNALVMGIQGDRSEQGVRPSYKDLQARLKELQDELAQVTGHRRMIIRSRYCKGL
jgi:hypothetical protein